MERVLEVYGEAMSNVYSPNLFHGFCSLADYARFGAGRKIEHPGANRSRFAVVSLPPAHGTGRPLRPIQRQMLVYIQTLFAFVA